MIEMDLIKFIVFILQNEYEYLSEYTLEYSTALLMNLSLRSSGKDKCENPELDLLKVLNDLLENENLQVWTYVNGTLYSIFKWKSLWEQAKEYGYQEVLQYLQEQSDEQLAKQISYILQQLNSEDDVDDEQSSEDEEQDEEEDEDFDEEDD